MAPKSIFRNPEAKHFSVLHRSQRDPLINDPENGDRILHETQRRNRLKTQPALAPKNPAPPQPSGPHDSSYNIFYDDPDYDYLQHLRPIGTSTDAVFVGKPHQTAKPKPQITMVAEDNGLPSTVQATPDQHTLSYADHLEFALPSNSAIPDDSLFPVSDDPALREVLEALEDEAYVEEGTDDGFFHSILKHGEADPNDPPEISPVDPPQSQWESEIARFKKSPSSHGQFDNASSSSDVIFTRQKDSLPNQKLLGQRTSVRGSVAGSAFSMSSSAMFRNQGLTDLDDRFDQIEKEYDDDDDDDDDGGSDCTERTTTPQVREDFEAIMDEFLNRFEVLGGKMKPALAGKTAAEKLDTLRAEFLGPTSQHLNALDQDATERKLMKDKILAHLKLHQAQDHIAHLRTLHSPPTPLDHSLQIKDLDDHRYDSKWDCQTILTTYSNLENHPRVIKIREAIGGEGSGKQKKKKVEKEAPTAGAKIGIDRATGFPVVDGKIVTPLPKHLAPSSDDDDGASDSSDSDDLESLHSVKGIIKRDRNEDKEAKKIRKTQLKAERAARRQMKKTIKENFTQEKNKQEAMNAKVLVKKSMDIAGLGGKHVISLL